MPIDRVEYRQVVNHRFNPFTESDQAVAVTNEKQQIPSSSPHHVQLKEVPRQDNPSTVTIPGFTEVTGTPASGEYRVDYRYQTGLIEFNAANAGQLVLISYMGTGTPVTGGYINDLLDATGFGAGAWRGHDWEDHFVRLNPASVATVTNRGGRTPVWTDYNPGTGITAISSGTHYLRVEPGNGIGENGWIAPEDIRISDNPFHYEFAFRTDIVTFSFLPWFIGIFGNSFTNIATLVAAGPFAAVSKGTTPGTLRFRSRDSSLSDTDNITLPTDIRSTWILARIECRPSQVVLSVANSAGIFEPRATFGSNIPVSVGMLFGFFTRNLDGTAHSNRKVLVDLARRVSLGNTPTYGF